jgi:hypothetical protein
VATILKSTLDNTEKVCCYNLVLDRISQPAKPLIAAEQNIHVCRTAQIDSLDMPDDWAPVNQNSDGNMFMLRVLLSCRPY